MGGFGSAIAELLSDHDVPHHLLRLGVPDVLVDHAQPNESKAALGLTPPQMADRILQRFKLSERALAELG